MKNDSEKWDKWALRIAEINRTSKERTTPQKEVSIWKRPCKLLRTKTLKIGRPKKKPELKKLTSERIRALQTAQKTTAQEKSWVEDSSGKEREKDTLRVLSSKRSKTTKTNCWVDKDLTKSHKKKGFEENGAVQNAVKNRTNKIWVEVELSKLPMKNIEIKKKKRY